MPTKLAIIYYSATGTVDAMARRVAATAEAAGAEVRLRHVAEIAPQEVIDSQDGWKAHREQVKDEPVATADDIEWADAVLFGTPTRYGNAASQLRAYIDTLGPLWQRGALADKAYAAFTASATLHGGQEATLLSLYTSVFHFGGILVAPGYTDPIKFADGNPYGVGKVTGQSADLDDTDHGALDHLVTRVLTVAGKLIA